MKLRRSYVYLGQRFELCQPRTRALNRTGIYASEVNPMLQSSISPSLTAVRVPRFLIIGAYKSGTTALYRYLNQHPQVYMSPLKETNFFALEGLSPNYQGPGDAQAPTNRLSLTRWDDYVAQFTAATPDQAIGEASPMYLYSPRAPERIQRYLPNAKLIAILRHPVERAYSNFLHLLRDGRERSHDFAQVWSQEDGRIAANWAPIWHWQNIGYYAAQLRRYFDRFSPEQIKVVMHEDLTQRPQTTFQEIFEFIGVDPQFLPDTSHRPNQSGIPKNRWVHGLVRRLVLAPLNATRQPALLDLSQKLRNPLLYKPQLSPQLKAELTALYRQDIEQLQALIGRDLSHWLA